MITKFKVFESKIKPKFKVGDFVYFNNNDHNYNLKDKKFKIVKCLLNSKNYILDKFLNFPVDEKRLISEEEYNENKYNL